VTVIAQEKIEKLHKDNDLLEDHPFMGRSIDGYDENLRILLSRPCVIIYDFDGEVVEILHVVEGRTNYIETILDDY